MHGFSLLSKSLASRPPVRRSIARASGRIGAGRTERFSRSYAALQRDNLSQNLQLVERLQSIATRWEASPAQIAIAWALARGAFVIPVIGARKRSQLQGALGALRVQ
jgi:aryl-alcohol dehydrogenase-like predicted oxidoreductase